MSERFGRNQKRRMREEIALLEAAIQQHVAEMARWRHEAWAARRLLADAESRAFERFMQNAERYEAVCARMASEVAKVAGQNLMPYAEQLMRHANTQRPMVLFECRTDPVEMKVQRLTVEWPAARFNVQLAGW